MLGRRHAGFKNPEVVKRVIRAARDTERMRNIPAEPTEGSAGAMSPVLVTVQIASTTTVDGLYPAVFVNRNIEYATPAPTGTRFVSYPTDSPFDLLCYVEGINQEVLVQDQYYVGYLVGVFEIFESDGETPTLDEYNGFPLVQVVAPENMPTASGASACASALLGDSSNCYLVTVVSASGLCATVDTSQEIELVWDAGNSDHRSGANSWTNADTTTGQVILDVSVYPPTATVSGVSGRFLGCSGDGGLLFAWKGNPPCASGTATPCGDALVLRFDCQCCSIAGWGGADKYYCTEGGVFFLTSASRCDTDIVIVDGPFDTEEDAEAACGTYPLTPSTTGCPDPGNIVAGQSGQFTVAPGEEHYFRATGLTELTDYHVDLTADSGRGAKLRYLTNIVDPCVGTTTTRADVSVGGSDCVTITTAAGETEIVFWVTVATTGSGDSTYTIAFNNGVC